MPVACHPVRYSGFAVFHCDRPGRIGSCRLEQERLLQGSLFFRAWKFVDYVQTNKMLPYMPGATIHNNEKIEIFKYLQDIYILWRILYI